MGDTSMGKARLQLFGSPRFFDAAGQVVALPARAHLLVLYLLASGRDAEIARAPLATFLWPDAPNPSANLRQLIKRIGAMQAIHRLDFIRATPATVSLNLDSIAIDYAAFRPALARLEWSNAAEVLEAYRDELLAGMVIPESDLSAWVDTQRAETRGVLVRTFAQLLDSFGSRGNPATAQRVAAALMEIEPYEEAAYRAMMRAFAANNMIAPLAATFEKLRSIARQEHGTEPSFETVDLFRQLTAGKLPAKIAASALSALPIINGRESSIQVSLPRLIVLPPGEGGDATTREIASLVLEDTVIRLTSLKTVSLVNPHTAWALSGKFDEDAAARFEIGYVLEAVLRSRGGEESMMVKLYDTRTRTISWANTYSLAAERLGASHLALVSAIAVSLADAVERNEMERYSRESSPQAYFSYLTGQKHLRFMDLPNVRRALKAFRAATTADPDFAPAFSGSARATQRQWLVLGRGDDALLDEAEQIGVRAVKLDHRDARGYREIALCNLYRRRWEDSVANFAEAERLGPQHADLISDFGDALGHAGEPEKGLAKVERAMELNPIPPDQYWWNAAGLHFQLHDYEKAIDDIGHMGDPLPALRIAAAAWAYLGNTAEARKCAQKFLRSYPDFRIDHWLSIVPDRNPDDRRHYEHGLRLAGFK